MSVSSAKPFVAVFTWFLSACLLCLGATEAHAASNSKHPIVHKVQQGQTLGMISHRWNVPLGGLCTANGINRKKPIHPGQELIIPALDDPEGKTAAKLRKRGFLDEKQRPKLLAEIEQAEKAEREKIAAAEKAEREKLERAKQAERDKARAEREKLERAKQAEREKAQRAKKAERATQRSARKLARKDRSERKSTRAQSQRSTRAQSQRSTRAKSSSRKVASNKPLRRRGYVRIKGLMGSWQGYALDQKGNVTEAAKSGFRKVLRSWRTGAGAEIEPRLIRMVADVSDHFGGKQILVVSGYRPKRKTQFTPHSRHNFGQAMDFHIEGVANEELRDYARKFNKAGVGYYPNSSFIHLDAREYRTYWIDYSGPGERPRYAHQGYTGRDAKAAPAPQAQPDAPTPAPEPEATKDAPDSDGKTSSDKVARGDG